MKLPNELGELLGHAPQDRASQWDVDDPRAERGTIVPLYTRMMRAYQGDPIGYETHQSTGPTVPAGLTNPADARTAVLYVAGASVYYRVDGGVPNPAGDQVIQEGSTVILTGKPTILGFQFASATAATSTVFVTYYD
jgi:hypothetical protein